MKSWFYTSLALFGLCLFSNHSIAGQANQCDGALAKDIYYSNQTLSTDYRLAILVDEKTFDERRANARGSAVIYGVPVGATYEGFQKDAHSRLDQRNESYLRNEARTEAWTGLSSTSAQAYHDCLRSINKGNQILLSAEGGTSTQISLQVQWSRDQFGPGKVFLEWEGPLIASLPKEINATYGTVKYSIPRPAKGEVMYVVRARDEKGNIAGSDDIVISAVRLAPPSTSSSAQCIGAESPQASASYTVLDFNGDGCLDKAAVFGLHLKYSIEIRWGFRLGETPRPRTIFSIGDEGWTGHRWWVDLDGDGPRFYCRSVGDGPSYAKGLLCSKIGPDGVEQRTIGTFDQGYSDSGSWQRGPSGLRFCRGVGSGEIRCTPTDGHKWTGGLELP